MSNQSTVVKQSISCSLAHRMISAAEHKARELGLNVATAVIDESGILKAFSRMDGAPLWPLGLR